MFDEIIREIFRDAKNNYYLNFAAIVCQLIALVYGLYFRRRDGAWKSLFMYVTISLFYFTVQQVYDEYLNLINKDSDDSSISVEKHAIIFAVVELSCFYYYYYKIFAQTKLKIALRISYFLFLLVATLLFIKISNLHKISDVWPLSIFLSAIEMILLSIPCFIFYYYLFKNRYDQKISSKPSFWIITGMLLYSTLTIPFFLIAGYLINIARPIVDYGFMAHLLLFSMLFLFLSKAFSLKKPLTS